MVFDKSWFDQHQSKLLFLLRFQLFRRILCIETDKQIVQILPNSYTVFLGMKGKEYELQTDFRTHNKYAKRLYFAFKPVWLGMHIWDLFVDLYLPRLSFEFTTLTQFPSSIGLLNPVDGEINRQGVDETFASIQGGAGTNTNVGGSSAIVALRGSVTPNQYSTLNRSIFLFDTSSLTSGATISAATIAFTCSVQANGLGSDDLHICSATPASDTTLAISDYSNLGTTSFGSLAYASWVVDSATYNTITLNASGISNISKTANSKFGARLNWDLNNTTVGLTWASSAVTRYFLTTFTGGGTSTGPKLVVTYTLTVSSFFNRRMRMGIG